MQTPSQTPETRTLAVIAARLGVPLSAVRIERGSVFYETPEGLRCACSVGTPYWHDAAAGAITQQIIEQAKARLTPPGNPNH